MKTIKTSFLILIVSSLFLFSSTIKAQENSQKNTQITESVSKTGELILGIPKLTDKNLFIITGALETIKGTEYIRFCPEQKLVLVKYNTKLFPNEEEVVQAILRQNVQMPMFIKEGTFAEVIDMCN
jgi:hypothetical protein